MAKHKKVTHKNIRPGHTVYYIDTYAYLIDDTIKPEMKSWFIHGKSQELPPEGCIIEKMPIYHIKKFLKWNRGPKLYFSRRKCQSALNKLINK